MGLSDPRARGLRRSHARPRERAGTRRRPRPHQAQGRGARRGRRGRRDRARPPPRRGAVDARHAPRGGAAHRGLPGAARRGRGRARAPALRDGVRRDGCDARDADARLGALLRRGRGLRGDAGPDHGGGAGAGRRGGARRPARARPAEPRGARGRQERSLGRADGADARARDPPAEHRETLGTLRPIAPDRAREMVADKYQDRFVDEYWSAWTRRLERLDAAPSGRNV